MRGISSAQDTLQRGFTNSNFPTTYKHPVLDAREDPHAHVPKYTTRHTGAAWSPLAGRNAAFSRLGSLHCLSRPPNLPKVSLSLCTHCSTLVSLATPNIHVTLRTPHVGPYAGSPPRTLHTSSTYTHGTHSTAWGHWPCAPQTLRAQPGCTPTGRPQHQLEGGVLGSSVPGHLSLAPSPPGCPEISIAQMGPGELQSSTPKGLVPWVTYRLSSTPSPNPDFEDGPFLFLRMRPPSSTPTGSYKTLQGDDPCSLPPCSGVGIERQEGGL